MESINNYVLKLMMVLVLIVPLRAVTVNPALCPTNKIAPYRRSGRQQIGPKTFGAFYDLLSSGPGFVNSPYNPGLQQDPDKDYPDDCGDIDDYDENDLSSLTPQFQNQYQQQQGYSNSRLFLGLFNNHRPQYERPDPARPPNYPHTTQVSHFPGSPQQPQRPQRPQRPYPQSRPPYASGGQFGNNPYRPPIHQDPSEYVKPVHEGHSEYGTTPTYKPEVVGGPIGHVVGVTTIKVPDNKPQQSPMRRPVGPPPYFNQYPQRPTETSTYTTRRPRPRNINNDSLLGSFIDLLF